MLITRGKYSFRTLLPLRISRRTHRYREEISYSNDLYGDCGPDFIMRRGWVPVYALGIECYFACGLFGEYEEISDCEIE